MKCLFGYVLACATTLTCAQPLQPSSPELKQLEAMGYEIAKVEPGDDFTVAANGVNKVALTRDTERLAITRFFNRKPLNREQEVELLRATNKVNIDLTYQVAIGEKWVAFALYAYNPYDARTFARLMRLIERVDTVFDTYPKLKELLQ